MRLRLLNSLAMCVLLAACATDPPTTPVVIFDPMEPNTVCTAHGRVTGLKDLDSEPIILYSCGYFFREDGKKILMPIRKEKDPNGIQPESGRPLQ